MQGRRYDGWNRREFLNTVGLAGTAALLGLRPQTAAAEPPPERTRLRIPRLPSTCRSPEWVAEELLRAEGFTEVTYVQQEGTRGWSGPSRPAKRTSAGTLQPR